MKYIALLGILGLITAGGWYYVQHGSTGSLVTKEPVIPEPEGVQFLNRPPIAVDDASGGVGLDKKAKDILGRLDLIPHEIIGYSVEGREIRAYRFGTGEQKVVLVGGLHGGNQWNTVLLAYQFIDFYATDSAWVPTDTQVIVIPVANPDGLFKAVGSWERFKFADAPQFTLANEVNPGDLAFESRFNAHDVDLNRNFDCARQEKATWRQYTVNAGPTAFSEPESAALRDFFLREVPAAGVFYHSASNGVYGSRCEGEPLPETLALLDVYSTASGYPKYVDYPHYVVTGDAADWLATRNIPAITPELKTHSTIEWKENFAGVQALLAHVSKNK
jgi:Zinc carboxypeptidase